VPTPSPRIVYVNTFCFVYDARPTVHRAAVWVSHPTRLDDPPSILWPPQRVKYKSIRCRSLSSLYSVHYINLIRSFEFASFLFYTFATVTSRARTTRIPHKRQSGPSLNRFLHVLHYSKLGISCTKFLKKKNKFFEFKHEFVSPFFVSYC